MIAGVAPTLRPANRQYAQIAADLKYNAAEFNPFDRLIDTDTPWRSNQTMGGGSVTVDWDRGVGRAHGNHRVAVLGLEPVERSRLHRPAGHDDLGGAFQAEAVHAGSAVCRKGVLQGELPGRRFCLPPVAEALGLAQAGTGVGAARFLLAPNAQANTPGLLDGYGQNIIFDFTNNSTAAFGQIEYAVTSRLRLIPGLRYNYDQEEGRLRSAGLWRTADPRTQR